MSLWSWRKLTIGFDRDLKLLLYSMSLRRVAIGFLGIVRVIYFTLIGFSPIEIGILLSIATFLSAIHHITFGILSDRFGRKPFLVLGGVFATMRMIIFAVSSDFWMLALGQGIGAMGEGVGAGQPVVSGYITNKTDITKRSTVFSTLAITNALAVTVGSLMAGFPTYFQNILGFDVISAHSLLFWMGAIINASSILLSLSLKDRKSNPSDKAAKGKMLKVQSWSVIARYSLVRSTSGIGWGFIESLMPLYFYLQFGVGGEIIGPIYAVSRFLSMFSYLFVPPIVKRFGEVPSIIAARFITAGLTILFSIVTWFPLAVVLMIILRVAIMFTMPIRQFFATKLVKGDEIATAIGVSNFSRMSLRTVAPTLAGYMFEAVSLSTPFLTGAFFLITNGALFQAFFNSRKKPRTSNEIVKSP